MKKSILTSLALLLLLALFAGCGGDGSLPEGMEKGAVETRAKVLIDAMNERDYDEMVALFTDGESLGITPPTAEEWAESVDPILDALGEFKEFGSISFASVSDDTYGDCGVALVQTKYENQTLVWQVSFTLDMEIIGLVA